MARLNSGTISRRTVEGLPVGEREAVFWDRELSGFGVRVYPSGAKVYLVQTRHGGKSRRVTIGRHGLVSAEQARRKAAVVIASIKAGEAPGRNGSASSSATGPTLAESGGPVHEGACGRALQADDGHRVPLRPRQSASTDVRLRASGRH